MESAMANASSTVYSVMLIIVLAFVVGHIGFGTFVRKKGGSAKLAQLVSSLATLIVMSCGVLMYVRN